LRKRSGGLTVAGSRFHPEQRQASLVAARSYNRNGEAISAKISTPRHNHDPSFKPLFGTDMIALALKGTACGDMLDFEGTALQAPGVNFKAVLPLISG
jgi:hypothetical protein